MSHRLLLIDGMNVVRRVYEAQPTEDSPEKAQGAMRSALGSFRRALRTHSPTHVLAAFDYGGPTWRHALLPEYHANRKPMPEPLKEALPGFYEELRELGVPSLSLPEVEADDVIATAALTWLSRGHGEVIILSTDKDLASLVAQGAQVWNHFDRSWRDEAWIQKKFGVAAAQLQDFLALTGDATDNVPGVPGVGPKTAAKWLCEYGSLEGLIEKADTVKGKIGERLRANFDTLELARQLVAFKTDITLGLTWNALRYSPRQAAAA